MQFKENKAIYLQISDMVCDDILSGKLSDNDKIASVRDLAALVEVNANTCARAYEWLQNQGIIFTKRGLGYFVNEGARQTIINMKREEFIEETIPEVARQMLNLGISIDCLKSEIEKRLENARS
ncbi:MAG: GntR family transcriptional regulator [Bacteroidaceae bacterium]|nr:GntR family transcriptional regulator [Bacteroidaceae bacterium]